MTMIIKNILIIDDSDVERNSVSRILKEAGYGVSEAISGEGGIRKAMELKPDLILMDVMMPGVNGFQATRHLQKVEETKPIPVLMLTSRGQETDKAWAFKQGAAGYLIKPAQRDRLLEEIKKLSQ